MDLISKPLVRVCLAAIIVIAAFAIACLALREVRIMIDNAVATKGAERDAYWTAKIEKADAEANAKAAQQAANALKIEFEANQRVHDVELKLADMEKMNAELPNGDDLGLKRDRVRLLPH
ncbi:hypothetical protein ACXHXM_02065